MAQEIGLSLSALSRRIQRLEREGRRFTVRPEKVRLLGADAGLGAEWHTEVGRVVDTQYAGSVTKYLVELDGGETLLVVRQNLETSSSQALEMRGTQVKVGWRDEQASAIREEEEPK